MIRYKNFTLITSQADFGLNSGYHGELNRKCLFCGQNTVHPISGNLTTGICTNCGIMRTIPPPNELCDLAANEKERNLFIWIRNNCFKPCAPGEQYVGG